MNDELEDFKRHLPSYLSPERQEELFKALEDFPKNINKNFYTTRKNYSAHILQGDICNNILIPDHDSQSFRRCKAMLISNTCDSSPDNPRNYEVSICFAPIIGLDKLRELISTNSSEQSARSQIESIRLQRTSNAIYLPTGGIDHMEHVVLLDKVFSLPLNNEIYESIRSNRICSLTNQSFYLFIYKLSLHFTRVLERIDRNES